MWFDRARGHACPTKLPWPFLLGVQRMGENRAGRVHALLALPTGILHVPLMTRRHVAVLCFTRPPL